MVKTAHFKGKTIPEQVNPLLIFMCIVCGIFGDLVFPPHFCLIFLSTFDKTIYMEPIGSLGQNDSFSRSNEPRTSKPPILPIFMCYSSPFFYDTKFRPHFCQNFHGRPTLSMEPIGPYGKNGPFSRSNEPHSRISTSFLPKFSWTSVKTLAMDPVGPHIQKDPISRIPIVFLPNFFMDVH
ncbi:hypothetical protein H5410_044067 [Solanum commersonii]|uniref:Uncharacterized protein n=1 Tax=Solanum commersonii TaxID=4109 RepID=A0A9J5XZD0_SOLCO|nr:hypothetical protein H5410_044067 [Solanum commersonii]